MKININKVTFQQVLVCKEHLKESAALQIQAEATCHPQAGLEGLQ